MIKYVDSSITFQEIPERVSLSFSISSCPNNCEGCHSSYLKEDIGTNLTPVLLKTILEKRIKVEPIDCVLFMGGEQFKDEFIELLKVIKEFGFKIALYTGCDRVDSSILEWLDYVKIGPYIESLGGLTSKTTNQRMYKKGKLNLFVDVTEEWFWKK